MPDRRSFLAGSAAALLAAPALGQTRTPSFQIPQGMRARHVRLTPHFPAGEIHIFPGSRNLYLTLGDGRGIQYKVGVGREGQDWSGEAVVGRKEEWPSWTPTAAMIEREPELYAEYADGMPGGPENPLGARALYLFRNGRDTLYRIHGTPNPGSVGSATTNGCIRMYNEEAIDLYGRVPIGTRVKVYRPGRA